MLNEENLEFFNNCHKIYEIEEIIVKSTIDQYNSLTKGMNNQDKVGIGIEVISDLLISYNLTIKGQDNNETAVERLEKIFDYLRNKAIKFYEEENVC